MIYRILKANSLILIQSIILALAIYFLAPPPDVNNWHIVSEQDCKTDYQNCATIYYSVLVLVGSFVLAPVTLILYLFGAITLKLYRYFSQRK